MKVAIAQINPTIGDLKGNLEKIISKIDRAKNLSADLIIFPELSIIGYPPRDLIYNMDLAKAIETSLKEKIAPRSYDIGIILGSPYYEDKNIYNSALFFYKGKLYFRQDKTLLPNYDVFDEKRYFKPASNNIPIKFKNKLLGITICEDIWNDKDYWNRKIYEIDPLEKLASQGIDIIINISASPYYHGKISLRIDMLRHIARKYKKEIIYVNQVGGNDELIFDGTSLVMNKDGSLAWIGKEFEEDFVVIDTNKLSRENITINEDISFIYKALVLGVRDYVIKTGFKKALVALSGGIDSSVTACLAVAALGKENVLGIYMPSRYSSKESAIDAEMLAKNLGIEYRVIPIEKIFSSFIETLNPNNRVFMDNAEENLQARIRGNIIMFISNREGYLVLSTGNKSELAMGYCTLYGDMTGGLSVIGDLPKTLVYELARYINRDREIIPERVLRKPPSAELRPNQKDEDSLPPYHVLDPIIKSYIEDNLTVEEIIKLGYNSELVENVVKKVDSMEYKRRQAPPVLKVTSKAFGVGRRMPIAWRRNW
ncbi:NAD+ synthase [Dictyoglomus thermophilum]|uniref:Glutamine-dependent NAD(+) synthetase n=1 Tax=Dictyoglomus thermophilum (strain ATCC 35947 / DSM 3960 / H-6-12) TaxID=309799 RepID=B5YBI9_DICT6|nr:NAD+ synthase [Dictyoglomus thermophilum]ACI19093.1 NH(3)-dependent NAD(+) synthetase [Dictyoglomus thermophilum H-6-12]